jgi:hypothetical protein
MDNQQKLTEYIQGQIQQGQTPDTIAGQLRASGWAEDQIKQAFLAVQAQTVPSSMQSAPVQNNTPAPQANGRRWGRIRTGWRLFTHSLKLLNGNRYLIFIKASGRLTPFTSRRRGLNSGQFSFIR